MEFKVLGPLEVRDQGEPLATGSPRTRALLAIFLTPPNQLVSMDQLVDELWPHQPPPNARALIYSDVSRLRRALRRGGAAGVAGVVGKPVVGVVGEPTDRLVTRKPGYLLRVEEHELDLDRFERLVADARGAASAGQHERSLALYRRAHQLWRGAPLADVPQTPMVAAATASLVELRLATLEEQSDLALATGGGSDLVAELTEQAAAHPLRERLVGQLMRAQHRAGRTADALHTYQQARQRLAGELGIEPGPELQRLHVAILRGEPVPEPRARSDPAPEPVRPAQLPADLHTFVGRAAEFARLQAACSGSDGGQPSATVVISAIDGMAGIGKTALAVHAAHQLAPGYPDGQLFLDLQGFSGRVTPLDPAEALDRMLRALGHPGERIPRTLPERASLFRSLVAARRLLILLDNAATEEQVAPLLPGRSRSLVVVTSRQRLTGLDDAEPLSLDVLPAPDSVSLFTQVAGPERMTREPADRVARVVELCGHLPLAIRIAAARLRARPGWSLQHLIERLTDQQRRLAELATGQRSLAATFAVSYQHLGLPQRRLFRLLGLHPGADFDAPAAAALADTSPRRAEQLLEDMVDAHLLQAPEPGRYRLHDLLRSYAAVAADRDEPEPARAAATTRLLDYYVDTASLAAATCYPDEVPAPPAGAGRAAPVDGPDAALAWLDAELANLLVLASCATGWAAPARVGQLSRSLARYLDDRARFAEAHALHTDALRATRAGGDPANEAVARKHLGTACWRLGRYHQALGHFSQAATRFDEVGDRVGQATTIANIGVLHMQTHEYARAVPYLEQALAAFAQLDERRHLARAHGNLGLLYTHQGSYDEAYEHCQRSLEMFRKLEDRTGEARAVGNLGLLGLERGRLDEAHPQLELALSIMREIGDRLGEAHVISDLGRYHRLRGRPGQAVECHRRALAQLRATGEKDTEAVLLNDLGIALQAGGRAQEALAAHGEARALAARSGNRYHEAAAHDGLGHCRLALDDRERARHHWRLALDLFTQLDAPEAAEVRSRLQSLG